MLRLTEMPTKLSRQSDWHTGHLGCVNELPHCSKHNSNPKKILHRPRNKTNEENNPETLKVANKTPVRAYQQSNCEEQDEHDLRHAHHRSPWPYEANHYILRRV